jgi:CDP-diacylglycerol--serine O-phosphatidyltransferase
MLAALFDLFDGMAARALKVASPLGKDLDSLADVVSFGLVPAFILYQLSASSPGLPGSEWVVYLYTVAAAIRLARFNQDKRQTKSFRGLASPAAALLIVSAVAFLGQNDAFSVQMRAGLTKIMIYAATLGSALLMLIPLPMPSLKMGGSSPDGGSTQTSRRADFIVLAGSTLIGCISAWFFLSAYAGIFCVVLSYIILSFLRLIFSPKSS